MKFLKGLYTDTSPNDQPEGTYRFAKNAILSNTKAALENEKGVSTFNDSLSDTIVGIFPIEDEVLVFSTNASPARDEIGIIDSTGSYTTVYSDTDLNFNTNNPIQAEYYRNFNNERIVAFTDDLNPPRIINIDDTSYISSIEDLDLFATFNGLLIDPSTLEQGGSLAAGAYQFACRYSLGDGTVTNWIKPSQVVYITRDTLSGGYNEYEGNEPGISTSKAVQLSFGSSVDTRFDFIEVAAIAQIGGITSAKITHKVPITGASMTINYTGAEEIGEVTVDEILVDTGIYKTAKAITSLNNQLYLGNLTTDDLIDFQPYANSIEINYSVGNTQWSFGSTTASSNNPKYGDVSPGFQHGEVYAFYIVFELKNGSYSRAFHIPGRAPIAGETGASVFPEVPSGALVYQVEDTSNNDPTADTNMGFWENVNETYPDTSDFDGSISGPDLAGEKVRHHRFPTIREMRNETGDSNYGRRNLRKLGIDVSNVNIPASVQDKINSWQIFYAKRSYANSTVVAQGLLQYGAAHEANTLVGGGGSVPTGSEGIMSSGGNWNLGNTGGGSHQMHVYTESQRFNSLDLLIDTPAVTPTYITNQVELSLDIDRTYTSGDGLLYGKHESGLERYALVNYFTNGSSADVVDADYSRTITNGQYIPANTIDGDYNNTYGHEAYVSDLVNGDTLGIAANAEDTTNNFFELSTMRQETYLSCLQQYKTDVYSSFNSQQLVATDKKQLNVGTTTLSNVFGGDTFATLQSFLCTSPTDGDDLGTITVDQGLKAVHYYIAESRNNVSLRHETPGNPQSFFMPKQDDLIDFGEIYDVRLPKTVGYTVDYSKVNDLNGISVFDTFTLFSTEFPQTIVYSEIQQTESQTISWRNFPVLNRYTMLRNRGEIINLQGLNNEDLLIHHENTLFRTKTNKTLQSSDGSEVVVGSSSIFSFPPVEIVTDKDGYAGTQHALSCILTKLGYAFVDDKQGKVFLYQGAKSLNEISSNGMRNFFRDQLKTGSADNPHQGLGYSISFDEDYNRLLLFANGATNPFVISYYPSIGAWTSYHDYNPGFTFSTVDSRVFATVGATSSNIYELNEGDFGDYKDDASTYPFIFDVVINPSPNETKVLSSLEWITEAYNGSDIYLEDETFEDITVRNNQQCSGKVSLEKAINLNTYFNTREEERSWIFNDFRDVAINNDFVDTFANDFNIKGSGLDTSLDWFNQGRFIHKYFIVRLEYSNTENNLLHLLDVSANIRKSFR